MSEREKPIVLPRHSRSSLEIKTGDWRTFKPEIRIKNSACWFSCPIHNRIRDYLQVLKNGKFEEAWQILVETNPLPAVLGRTCPYPCESECLRTQLDQTLAINTIEKILGDTALHFGWKPKGFKDLMPRLVARQRVAIIGAGPAGLACAYQLRRLGYWVDIFEAEKKPGGMLYFGIPSYRLPKDLLFQEIENNILSLGGVKIHCNVEVTSLTWYHFVSDFDAVLIAVGNQKNRKLNIRGEAGNPQIISGLDFLKKVNLGEKIDFEGKIVAVVGAGNTAIDAGRSAKKIGARTVFILYRRREEDMPAFPGEIQAAKNEGVEIIPLVAPLEIDKKCDGILRIECCRVDLGEPDKSGRPKPVLNLEPSSRYVAFAHYLIVAVGEESDLSFVKSDEEKLLLENAFLAGDVSSREGGTVASAIGSGNKAAREIDWYLKTGERKEFLEEVQEIVRFEDLNSEYFEYNRGRLRIHPLICSQDILGQLIREEAERCFSCGSCNACGNCWLFCPDVAVKEKEGKFEIDYEYCKGCGICANECPRNAIDMKREDK